MTGGPLPVARVLSDYEADTAAALAKLTRERDEARREREVYRASAIMHCRERDDARRQLARMREDRDRLNVQRNALAGANDAWIRDLDAARDERDTAWDALGKILAGLESGAPEAPLDDEQIIAAARKGLGRGGTTP